MQKSSEHVAYVLEAGWLAGWLVGRRKDLVLDFRTDNRERLYCSLITLL